MPNSFSTLNTRQRKRKRGCTRTPKTLTRRATHAVAYTSQLLGASARNYTSIGRRVRHHWPNKQRGGGRATPIPIPIPMGSLRDVGRHVVSLVKAVRPFTHTQRGGGRRLCHVQLQQQRQQQRQPLQHERQRIMSVLHRI